jgi:hypothetical protein
MIPASEHRRRAVFASALPELRQLLWRLFLALARYQSSAPNRKMTSCRRSWPLPTPSKLVRVHASNWRIKERSHLAMLRPVMARRVKLPRRTFLHLAAGAAALPAVSRFAWASAAPLPHNAGGRHERVAQHLGGPASRRPSGVGGAPGGVSRPIRARTRARHGESISLARQGRHPLRRSSGPEDRRRARCGYQVTACAICGCDLHIYGAFYEKRRHPWP